VNPRLRPLRFLAAAALLIVIAGSSSPLRAQQLTVTPDHADGVYDVGQTIRWSVEWDDGGGEGGGATTQPTTAPSVQYVVKRGGLTEVGKGTLTLTGGAAVIEARLDEPGTLLLTVTAKTADGKDRKAVGGAVAAPAKIAPSADRPADFDAWWDAKINALAAIPPNAQLESGEAGKPGVHYEKITFDHVNGTRIRGQLARPEAGDQFPAVLVVQWAGVYGLQKGWVTDRAADGWLALNILAHDLPIDQPESFYQEQSSGPLRDYPAIGNDDRETSYFLRMYLSCYRAAEYLTTHPNWDGRTLVVMGGSQGGQQALVTAAIHPKVTAAMANVPAGCDMLGPAIGRQGGWPMWYWKVKEKDPANVREASRYFDVVNFAPRITAPVLVGVGLVDETCPPAGILAATNLVRGPKEIILLPRGGHNNDKGSHEPYDKRLWGAWLPALRAGKPAPVGQ
jgi:cephalosporin-C deacetylase-like acetyl esterase